MIIILVLLLLALAPSILAQTAPLKPVLKIVNIGDSYSSGNGATDHTTGGIDYVHPAQCVRSPSSWGEQYVRHLRDRYNIQFINRACAGGFSLHLQNSRTLGTHGGKCKDVARLITTPDEEYVQEGGSCARIVHRQVDSIDRHTDMVFMTMGGNDLGFEGIVIQCVLLPALMINAEKCREAVEKGFKRLPVVEIRITQAVREIRRRMGSEPNKRIVVFMYPHVTLASPKRMIPGFKGPHHSGDYDLTTPLRELVIKAAEVMRSATDRMNAEFMSPDFGVMWNNTIDVFSGHEPDPRFGHLNPDRYLHEMDRSLLHYYDMYHPNWKGHKAWAEELAKSGDFNASTDGSAKPMTAWMRESYVNKPFKTTVFEAYGSHSRGNREPIVKYEWDVNGDKKYDATTTEPFYKHRYKRMYKGRAHLRITSASGETAEAWAHVHIMWGSVQQLQQF